MIFVANSPSALTDIIGLESALPGDIIALTTDALLQGIRLLYELEHSTSCHNKRKLYMTLRWSWECIFLYQRTVSLYLGVPPYCCHTANWKTTAAYHGKLCFNVHDFKVVNINNSFSLCILDTEQQQDQITMMKEQHWNYITIDPHDVLARLVLVKR